MSVILDDMPGGTAPEELMRQYCETRDLALRNQLAENYIYIAQIVARRFSGRGVDYDDLYQVASLALIRALERYDCGQGVRFPSYATPVLVGEVKNYFRDRYTLIRMPRRHQEMARALDMARDELTRSLGRAPTVHETALEAGMALEVALDVMESQTASFPRSLDAAADAEGEGGIGYTLGADDDNYSKVEEQDMLVRLISTLSGSEKALIRQRFFDGRSQREVAARLGVSQMHVSRLERKLIERMRKAVTSQGGV